MMKRELTILKDKDWSLNLEDDVYAERPEELIADAIDGVRKTAPGFYVNLVTHEAAGHPENGLIGLLTEAMNEEGVAFEKMVYIDECGCGGFVTRVYR